MDPSGLYMMPSAYAGPAPPPSPLVQQQQQQQVVLYGVEIPSRVFVGGCPYNMTELELSNFFSQFGEVRDSKIITDRDGGKSKGYGFVTFSKEEDAIKVISMGSIYYQQKKLNVSKAIRKYGGQYQKANQEYMNGQKMIWMHPSGYLMSTQEGSWNMEQVPSHSQPVKPYYPVSPTSPAHPSSLYYSQATPYHPNTNAWIGLGQTLPPPTQPVAMTTNFDLPNSDPSSYQLPTKAVGQEALESSGSSTMSEPHSDAHSNDKKFTIDMKLIDEKTKQLSLDSAYTSEADLDASHNSTATNSRATSPKLATMIEKEDSKEKEEGDKEQAKEASAPETTEEKVVKVEEKEKHKVRPKPQKLFTEFIPSNLSTVSFSSPPAMIQQPQNFFPSHPYVSPPLSPLAVQIAPQQCFTFYPTQEFPTQIISIGSQSAGNPML